MEAKIIFLMGHRLSVADNMARTGFLLVSHSAGYVILTSGSGGTFKHRNRG